MSDPKKERVIAPQSQEIPLDYPVDIDGVKTSSLTMRRSKIKDILDSEKVVGTPLNREVSLIAVLCSVPPSLIGELDEDDYLRIQKILDGKDNTGGEEAPLSDPPETSESGAPKQPKD